MPTFSPTIADRSTIIAVASRVIGISASLVTIILIGSRLSAIEQGYYYSFISLIGLSAFLELGFCLVITQFASHEWAHLKMAADGAVLGNPQALSRLGSLARLMSKWYGGVSLLFILFAGFAGFVFFSHKPQAEVAWRLPWLTLVVVEGLRLWLLPVLSLLEGCNQIARIYTFRLAQNLIGNACMWAAILLGGGLWVGPVFAFTSLLSMAALLIVYYRRFITSFISQYGEEISWREEILPMQWRLGVSGIATFFASSLFVPVMFKYHGPVIAGQMGMTWQIVGALLSVSGVWIQSQVPAFGMFVAKRDYPSLDRLILHVGIASTSLISLGAVGVLGGILLLTHLEMGLAVRLLPAKSASLFLAAAVAYHVAACGYAYIRAHKCEPLMPLSVLSSLLIGFSTWWFGGLWGPMGAGTGYLTIIAAILLPGTILFTLRFRQQQLALLA
jgi:hypothetical protein